jgi:hypothetical protein
LARTEAEIMQPGARALRQMVRLMRLVAGMTAVPTKQRMMAAGGSAGKMSELYDADFLLWSEWQAALLRCRAAGELVNEPEPDWLNLAEEIESVGASEKREVRSRLALIIQHILKWYYQPQYPEPESRWRSWRATLYVQRRDLKALFEDSPSLRPFADRILLTAFAQGRQAAEIETGVLGITDVPPWTLEQIIADDFFPDDEVG